MKFQAPKKLVPDDYPKEFRSIALKLFTDLNQFMQNVGTILTQGIVLNDNVKSLKINLSIQTSQTYPIEQDLSSFKDRPTAVFIGEIRPTDETVPSSAFSVHWTFNNGLLSYTLIGLSSSKAYKGTLVVLF